MGQRQNWQQAGFIAALLLPLMDCLIDIGNQIQYVNPVFPIRPQLK